MCLRVAVFPLVILAQRNAANMHNHMPIIQNLQAKFTKARVSGNALEGNQGPVLLFLFRVKSIIDRQVQKEGSKMLGSYLVRQMY